MTIKLTNTEPRKRWGVFTEDGLDLIEDTLVLANKHAVDLQLAGNLVIIMHDTEDRLDILNSTGYNSTNFGSY
jgi:hypothetical protein